MLDLIGKRELLEKLKVSRIEINGALEITRRIFPITLTPRNISGPFEYL